MYDFIRRWAEITPERVAIEEVRTGRSWTFSRLDIRSEQLARSWRRGLGLEEGQRVAMLCEGRGEVFEGLFAAAKARLTLVPLNWRLAANELAAILKDASPAVFVYDATHAELAAELLDVVSAPVVALDAPLKEGHLSWQEMANSGPVDVELAPLGLEDVPLMLYTSGTTGGPKGVMFPWRQIVFNAINTVIAADLSPADATLACLPLFHTGGLNALATPTLYRGGRVLLAPSFDPEEATWLLRTGRATTTIAVPTMYEMMDRAGLLAPGSEATPRALLCGGAPISRQVLERFHSSGMTLRQGYGLTEVGPNCFTLSPADGPDRIGTVGFPAFHGEVRLVDEHGKEVPDGTPGELHLRGPHVSLGYSDRPDLTSAVLDEDGWFRTGDLLVRNERGAYSVIGRLKDMFISGGENVYPAEVENVLEEHPQIRSAAVVGVDDSKWGQVGCGVIIPEFIDAPPEPNALRAWLRERLARYKVPKYWRFVETYPLNAAGKVEKTRLHAVVQAELEGEP